MVTEINLIDIKSASSIYTPDKKFGAIKIEGINEDEKQVDIIVPSPIVNEFVYKIVTELTRTYVVESFGK